MLTDIESLLIHNSVNEVLHGVPETPHVQKLLSRKRDIERFAEEWSRTPSEELVGANRDLVAACINVALTELDDEFETRVGVEQSVAKEVLERLGFNR